MGGIGRMGGMAEKEKGAADFFRDAFL